MLELKLGKRSVGHPKVQGLEENNRHRMDADYPTSGSGWLALFDEGLRSAVEGNKLESLYSIIYTIFIV